MSTNILTVSQAIVRYNMSNIEAVWCIFVGCSSVSMENLAKLFVVERSDVENDF